MNKKKKQTSAQSAVAGGKRIEQYSELDSEIIPFPENKNQKHELTPVRTKSVEYFRKHELNELFFENDPNKYDEVKASIQNSGILQPITVKPNDNTETSGVVLGGHVRLEIAKEIGLEKIPVRFTRSNISRKDEIRILAGDNQTAKKNDLAREILKLAYLFDEYFQSPKRSATVALEDLEKLTGKKSRTLKLYKDVVLRAFKKKGKLTVENIRLVLEEINQERRKGQEPKEPLKLERSNKPKSQTVKEIVVEISEIINEKTYSMTDSEIYEFIIGIGKSLESLKSLIKNY